MTTQPDAFEAWWDGYAQAPGFWDDLAKYCGEKSSHRRAWEASRKLALEEAEKVVEAVAEYHRREHHHDNFDGAYACVRAIRTLSKLGEKS